MVRSLSPAHDGTVLIHSLLRSSQTLNHHTIYTTTVRILCRANAGVVSAPLYDSSNYTFAGMFTMVDVIHLIQYYYLSATGYDNAAVEVESVDLSALRGELLATTTRLEIDQYAFYRYRSRNRRASSSYHLCASRRSAIYRLCSIGAHACSPSTLNRQG